MPTVFYLTPLGMMPKQLRSDTIVGAVIWALAKMGEDVESLIQDTSLRVSSAFPYAVSEGGDRIKFVPKPLLPFKSSDSFSENRNKKTLKKIPFLELDIFNDLVTGKVKTSELVKKTGAFYRVKGSLLVGAQTDAKISSAVRERNTINRLSLRAEDFFMSYGTEYVNSGIYFIAEGSENWIRATKMAIGFLEDRGLGGEISIGQGHFKFEHSEESSPFTTPSDPDSVMVLSLYLPTSFEWNEACKNKERLYYSIVRRAGRRSDGKPKRSVYCLGEGSVIPLTSVEGRHEFTSENPKAVAWGHPLYVGIPSKAISEGQR